MVHRNIVQGSEEWKALRIGAITASRVIGILKGPKGYYLSTRKNYMAEKVCEILTGKLAEHFISKEMQRGIDEEPIARTAYEIETGNFVEEVGIVDHPFIENLKASPDGLLTDGKGGIEIKNPNTANHLLVLLGGKIKYDYIIQMQVNMMCAEREYWDYVDYDSRLPDKYALFIKRFYRDEKLITEITNEVILFNSELKVMIEKLKGMK